MGWEVEPGEGTIGSCLVTGSVLQDSPHPHHHLRHQPQVQAVTWALDLPATYQRFEWILPQALASWCEESVHRKRPWCWKNLRAGGEGVEWHHWLNGHEFGQTPENTEGQGGLACSSPWGSQKLGCDLATEQQKWFQKLKVRDQIV